MQDIELFYPGALSRILYKFVADPLNLYGGNLLGTYKLTETQIVPAISIEKRSPSILAITGIEIVIEAIPRNVVIESFTTDGLKVKLEWGFYVVNKTGSDANLVHVLLRLLQTLNTGEAHLLDTEDKVSNGSQFFYSLSLLLNISNFPATNHGICDFTLPDVPCLPDLPVDASYYEDLNFAIS